MWEAAEEHAIQLLHDVTMKSAIEGVRSQHLDAQTVIDLPDVPYLNPLPEHRLALMPAKFKTPGSGQAPLIAGNGNKVMIMTAERQDELIRLRREQLEAMNPKRLQGASNEAATDSGNSPGSVQ